MFNWWKKKQERKQEESDTPIAPTLRYKAVQHVVTGKWAVWDTERQKALDLVSANGYWWDSSSKFYRDTWTDDKELVENVVRTLNETGCLWR